jgi:hypothetical protein
LRMAFFSYSFSTKRIVYSGNRRKNLAWGLASQQVQSRYSIRKGLLNQAPAFDKEKSTFRDRKANRTSVTRFRATSQERPGTSWIVWWRTDEIRQRSNSTHRFVMRFLWLELCVARRLYHEQGVHLIRRVQFVFTTDEEGLIWRTLHLTREMRDLFWVSTELLSR